MSLLPEQLAALTVAAQAAVASERAAGCPALVTVAQWALESGWGKHQPGNNCFGIKATDTHATYCYTEEWVNGCYVTERLAFETYPTLADCFIAHAELITGGRYAPAFTQYQADRDVGGYIDRIAPIYATAPNYAATIRKLAQMPEVVHALADAEVGN